MSKKKTATKAPKTARGGKIKGYRKDGKRRVPITLSVDEDTLKVAKEKAAKLKPPLSGSLSSLFERQNAPPRKTEK